MAILSILLYDVCLSYCSLLYSSVDITHDRQGGAGKGKRVMYPSNALSVHERESTGSKVSRDQDDTIKKNRLE